MCTILLRFRTFPYGLSADIEKAFLHVGLDDNDRDFTRFLWLSDPMNPESVFNTFRFKTVLFGSTSSPFLLNATLRCHLQNYDQAVAHDIKNNIYVDNVISGCENETDTVQYYSEARSIMQNRMQTSIYNRGHQIVHCYKRLLQKTEQLTPNPLSTFWA